MRRRYPFIVLSLTTLIALIAAAAEPREAKRGRSESTSIIDISPHGRPPRKAREQALLIWQDDEGWHVRGHGGDGRGRSTYDGTIRVENGKLSRIWGIQGLEATGKGTIDAIQVSKDKKTIGFRFQIGGLGEDGFDFQVASTATRLHFSVLVNSYDHPDKIRIGAGGKLAPASTFSLPTK